MTADSPPDTKQVKSSRRKPPAAGKGRPKGSKNKTTANIKAAIEEAFEKAGGVEYLLTIAKNDPRTFAGLLGKVLPTQITGDPENPIHHKLTISLD